MVQPRHRPTTPITGGDLPQLPLGAISVSTRRSRIRYCLLWIAVITAAFSPPLIRLVTHALASELLSYIPLVPFVAGYLLFIRWNNLPAEYRTSVVGAAVLCIVAGVALAGYVRWGQDLSANDGLTLLTLAYLSAVAAGGFLFLGSSWMTAAAFPISFLAFMIPLPDAVVYQLEMASVLASADVSAAFFRWTGTPLLREGTIFALPGIVLQVAQECSGIHSSWILLITSVVASHLFLNSPWRRFILIAFVIPLAIVRNSFRILVIGLLCVHIGPHMIDSIIHRQGGPLFFALSLGPLLLLLVFLRRQER